MKFALMGDQTRPMLLGRITAKVGVLVRVGERCVVLAWRRSLVGGSQMAGSAVLGDGGTVAGVARATWFDVIPSSTSASP